MTMGNVTQPDLERLCSTPLRCSAMYFYYALDASFEALPIVIDGVNSTRLRYSTACSDRDERNSHPCNRAATLQSSQRLKIILYGTGILISRTDLACLSLGQTKGVMTFPSQADLLLVLFA